MKTAEEEPKSTEKLQVLKDDSYLEPYGGDIEHRQNEYRK